MQLLRFEFYRSCLTRAEVMMELFGLSVHPSVYQKPIPEVVQKSMRRSLKRLRRDPRVKRLRAGVSKALASWSVEALKFASQMRRPSERIFQVRGTDDGWMVCERGSLVPLQVYKRKPEAAKHARQLAKNLETQVEIFDRRGSLQKTEVFRL
jgi:hypothetical protein